VNEAGKIQLATDAKDNIYNYENILYPFGFSSNSCRH